MIYVNITSVKNHVETLTREELVFVLSKILHEKFVVSNPCEIDLVEKQVKQYKEIYAMLKATDKDFLASCDAGR